MSLESLEITDFRCIASTELDLDPTCSVFIGENASGKTSLLEAISVLSTGRSFRSNRISNLIRTGCALFQVAGTVDRAPPLRIALQATVSSKEIHIGGEKTQSFAPLAIALPVLVIDPSAHKLLEEGPNRRRRFLDWGTFHVEPRFIGQWRRYLCALSNRNAALKASQSMDLIRSWDDELVEAGTHIADYRAEYLGALQVHAKGIIGDLLGLSANIIYGRGWRDELTLREAVEESWRQDLRQKTTTVGPHRADFQIQLDHFQSKDRISRGQQKLLACALILAQTRYRASSGSDNVSLLLDDPAAELDVDNLSKLLCAVASSAAQLIVTGITVDALQNLPIGKMFHVKQGAVTAML